MTYQTLFILVLCVLCGLTVFNGMTKGVKKSFEEDPAEETYHSQGVIEKQSEKTLSIQEKNERMMDNLRSQMDKVKR